MSASPPPPAMAPIATTTHRPFTRGVSNQSPLRAQTSLRVATPQRSTPRRRDSPGSGGRRGASSPTTSYFVQRTTRTVEDDKQSSRAPSLKAGQTGGRLMRTSSPGTPSPFRDILKQHSVHTREGRVLTLLSDFSAKVTRPCRARVEETLGKVKRTRFLPADDRVFLSSVRERNANFMTNLESILNSAVDDHTAMDRSVVQRCYQRWAECNAQNCQIDETLQAFPSETSSPQILQPRRGSSPNGRGRSDVQRSVVRRKPTDVPKCFDDIPRPLSRQPSRAGLATPTKTNAQDALSPSPSLAAIASSASKHLILAGKSNNMDSSTFEASTSATMSPVPHRSSPSRGRSPPSIHPSPGSPRAIVERTSPSLASKPIVTSADAKEAQTMFIRLFGEEQGKAQFLAWLSELPIDQLRTLQAQLQSSRN